MNKLAFFFNRTTKAQRESDKAVKKDWTKKPYKTKEPTWKNLWNSDTREGQSMLLRGGNTSGVTSKQVLNHFKNKYKMDIGNNSFTDPAVVNSAYVPPHSARLYKYIVDYNSKDRKLGFFEKFLTSKKGKEIIKQRREEYKKLKTTFDKNYKKRDGNLLMDKEVMKFSPEVIAHELGHAHNYTKSKHKKLYNFFNGVGGALIPLGGFAVNYAIKKKHPNLGLGVAAATSMVGPISTLIDEYQASNKATKAIKELGGTPHPKKLRSAFSTYLAVHGKELVENGILLGAAVAMHKMNKK